MFCKECGEENRNDRKFCSNCGANLVDYTKPREDLIMPEEIKKEQEKVQKKNKVTKIFDIIFYTCLTLAIAFTIASFFVPKKVLIGFSITCIVLYSILFISAIIRKIILKKIQKS